MTLSKIFCRIENDGSIKYTTETSVDELSSNLTLNDIDPILMQDNGGSSMYVVDTKKDDDYNFYGPYFYKGNADILKITDKSLWKEIDQSDRDVLEDSRENELIQSFFSLIVNDLSGLDANDDTLFKISEINDITNEYSNFMKINAPNVLNKILNNKKTLENGKRFNAFNKIPLLYTMLLEEIVSQGLDNYIILKTRDYFRIVCDVYDNNLRALFPKSVITPNTNDIDSISEKDGLLSFRKLFGFDTPNFNYSNDMDYYTDKIKLHYPKILSATKVATLAMKNSHSISQLFKFDFNWLRKQIGESDFDNESEWKYIWELFTCNSPDMTKLFFNNHKNEIYFSSFDEFSNRINPISSKNYLFTDSLRREYEEQIRQFLDGESPQSSLSMLKDINNLKELLSKVGNSFAMFCVYKNLFINKSSYFYVSIPNSFKDELNRVFNSLETINDPFSSDEIINKSIKQTYDAINKMNLISDVSTYLIDCGNSSSKFTNSALESQFINTIKLAGEIWGFVRDFASAVDDFEDFFNTITVFTNFTLLIPGLNVLGFAFEAFSFLVDFILPKYESKSYIYKSDNVEYIWDGGLKTNMLFGFVENEISGINNMKLLDPIKIDEPRNHSYYYLNGKQYNENIDDEKLIRDYSKLVITNRIESDRVKKYYSFDVLSNNYNSYAKPSFVKDTLDELVDEVYNSVFINNNSNKYLANNDTYKFSVNGVTKIISSNNSRDKLIDYLTTEMKPIKIAMIPYLDENGYPITRNDTSNDNSIPQYILPGDSYDFVTGSVIKEETKPKNNKYIVVDPNISLDGNNNNEWIQDVINDPLKVLYNDFYNSFKVDSKIIYEHDAIDVEKFSDFSYQPNQFFMYKAVSPFGEVKYFLNKENAFSWLYKKNNIKYVESQKEEVVYTYMGTNKFYSIDEFYKWVELNTQVI